MKIYAIVVVYNGLYKNWIKKCFDSLLQSSIPINIIAVDNVSTDGSIKYIKDNYPSVYLIENKKNLGFGKANNIGIQEAIKKNAEYFFLLNQDAWVEDTTIEVLIKNSIENPEYGILSPLHLNGDGSLIDEGFFECINPYKSRILYSSLCIKNITKSKIFDFDFIPAACWLLPRKTIDLVGGFSPTFYHYAEDDNYVHRLHFHCFKVGLVPYVVIYHDREKRKPNLVFDDALIKYKRKVIIDISNPLLHGNKKFLHYRLLISEFFQALIFFDWLSIKFILKKFKTLINIKDKKLIENRELSKNIGNIFLN